MDVRTMRITGLALTAVLPMTVAAQDHSEMDGRLSLTSAVQARNLFVLEIVHDTSVIPPRAMEALICDPLDRFTTDGVPDEQRMNVGLRVVLELNAPGATTIENVQWTIPGSVIGGYHTESAVDIEEGFLIDCSTTALSGSDLQQSCIAFYYTEPGTSVVVLDALIDGFPMTAMRTFVVDRNPKAEIFYVTGPGTGVNQDINNDGFIDIEDLKLYQETYGHDADPAGTMGFGIIGEHRFWHELFPSETEGDEFFRFHRGFIGKLDCWRGIFGYPCVAVYATAPSYVPGGMTEPEVDHAGLPGDGNGIINAPRDTNHQGSVTELPERFTIAGDGGMSLADFASSHDIVVSIKGYHDSHHGFICHAGDFFFTSTTPADPIFWRFHLMLTKVYELWQWLQLDGETIDVDPEGPDGTRVYFPDPDVTVATGCSPQEIQDCSHESGSLFPIGTTVVTCTLKDVMMFDDTFPDDPGLNQGTTTEISFEINIVNTPPTVDCDPAVEAECASPDGTEVTLTADVDDADGQQLTVTWEVDAIVVQVDVVQPPATVELTHTYSLGSHVITVTADDGFETTECETLVDIVDTTPPVVVVGDLIELWPPNFKYHTLSLADCVISVEDACDGLLNIEDVGMITSIYSDEPENVAGGGDGNSLNDIVILGPIEFKVRAERQGGGNGRVYGINFEATDASGNVTAATCFVGVPHSQFGDPPVDDGPAAGYTVFP